MQLAGTDITRGKFQTSTALKSHPVSKVAKQTGIKVVLLKMDRLLQHKKWDQVQTLAEQFGSYFHGTVAKSALLADQAVAWQHQKQFAKALAAYQAIDALSPDTSLAGHYEAPDYKLIEDALQDSMKIHNQKSENPLLANSDRKSESPSTKNKQLPKKYSLGKSYPNPFNPTATIPFSLPEVSHVRIQIYNIMGQKVITLTDRQYQAGNYQIRFDGKDFASGVYFIRAMLGKKIFIKRMTLIK